MIDLRSLPKEIQDIIELKEAMDQTFYRFTDSDYTDYLWNMLAERSNPDRQQSFVASCSGIQGSGKSMAAISMCCMLDPNFSMSNCFFSYDDLVRNRAKLKPGSAVLVDEQSELYGLDSHRINIILSNLKEQLRKKSIHFIFCAPILYSEHQSSMFLFETIFIDYEGKECYVAMKTRDGLTLGHVRIPHPLKILEDGCSLASQELMDAYQKKKDEHLEKVLGNAEYDEFEVRAKAVMEHPLFLKAEKLYKRKMGYIPNQTLIQVINKIFPDYNAGVVPLEIAGRIKLDKELSGDWEVSGKSTRKDRK